MRRCTVSLMARKCVTLCGRAPVPLAQPAQKTLQQPRLEPRTRVSPKYASSHVPGVAHRREAVADVRDGIAARTDRLGDAVAEADNQIAGRQTPARRGRRHERQQIAIIAVAFGQKIEEAGARPQALDGRADGAAVVQQA